MKSPIMHRDLNRTELETHSIDNLVALALVQNEEARLAIEEYNKTILSFNKLAKNIEIERVESNKVNISTMKLRDTTIQRLKSDLDRANEMVDSKIEQKQELHFKLNDALFALKKLRAEVETLKEPACFSKIEKLEAECKDNAEIIESLNRTIEDGPTVNHLYSVCAQLEEANKTIEENELIIASITKKLDEKPKSSFEGSYLIISKELNAVKNKLETCEACNVVVHDELDTLRETLRDKSRGYDRRGNTIRDKDDTIVVMKVELKCTKEKLNKIDRILNPLNSGPFEG